MERTIIPLKVHKWGTSLVVTLPPLLRKKLNINQGDYICVRLCPPYATFCVWPNVHVPYLSEIAKGDRAPRTPEEILNARTTDGKTLESD